MTPVGDRRRLAGSRRAAALVVVLPLVPVTPTVAQRRGSVAVHGRGDRSDRRDGCRRRRAGRPSTSGRARGRRAAPPPRRRPPRAAKSWPSRCGAADAGEQAAAPDRRGSRGSSPRHVDRRPSPTIVGRAERAAGGSASSSRQLGDRRRRHGSSRSAARSSRRGWLMLELVDHRRGQLGGTPAPRPCHRSGRRCRPAARRSRRGSSPADPRPGRSRRSWRSRRAWPVGR